MRGRLAVLIAGAGPDVNLTRREKLSPPLLAHYS